MVTVSRKGRTTSQLVFACFDFFFRLSVLDFVCQLEEGKRPPPKQKTRFSIWTLLRTPGRFTTRPLPVYFTTKMSAVRPFSVLIKTKLALSKTGRSLSKAEILGGWHCQMIEQESGARVWKEVWRVNWKPGLILRHGVCYFMFASLCGCASLSPSLSFFPTALLNFAPLELTNVLDGCCGMNSWGWGSFPPFKIWGGG